MTEYYDVETNAMISIAAKLPIGAQRPLELQIRERLAMMRGGTTAVPAYVQRELHQVDHLLRCRWDFWKSKRVIERLCPQQTESGAPAWVLMCDWPDNDAGVPMSLKALCDLLREADTWRYPDPQEYLRVKRARAAEIRRRNEQASTARVLEAVDSLSAKQIQNFIAVEKALHTGETIVSHGEDEKFLERAHHNTLKAEAEGVTLEDPRACINPGSNPLLHKHVPLEERREKGEI